MTKKLGISNGVFTGTATVNNWKANTKLEILNNSGVTPIRIDKLLLGFSGWQTHSIPVYAGVLVHLSDTNGNTLVDTVDGTGADTTADLNTLMEKWKDYIWMTDFRAIGTGYDESVLIQYDLEAATKRVLLPGQKMYVSILWMAGTDNSAQNMNYLLDYALWYQQAASQ